MRGRRPSAISAYAASSIAVFESGLARDNRSVSATVGFSSDAMLQSACLPVFTEVQLNNVLTLSTIPTCGFCGAFRFPYEPPTFCCDRGKIRLVSPNAPVELINLFADPSSPMAITFRRKIRLYNSIFSFTSFGVRTDKSLAYLNRGVYTFRAAGQVFHTLPPLVPEQGRPKYFQLYFWDNDNELHNRMTAVNDEAVDESTMILLMNIMQHNPYVEILRRINEYSSIQDVRLHISKNILIDQRCYNCPSADQVAAIWVEGNDNTNIPYDRDIVVRGNDGDTHLIKHYFGCYDPLQYPLFFPYGDCGWQQHILKCLSDQHSAPPAQVVLPSKGLISFDQIVSKESQAVRGKNDRMVSCREYYCYRLQIRENDSSVLLYGGRLLQQFVVDMYIKLETTRLDYYRRNQAEIRSELYQGIVDSVASGETRGAEVGRRVVLPSSFIGGPRDMRKRYLDAMALVRYFGKPDLFITMTCNPEWPEIKNNLFDDQTPHDRPDLVSRVFRARLVDLKDQIIKKRIFGSVAAYVYVIEFQKRGLPHCHFLVILKSEFKISSPDVFDRYVSAEIPNKNLFPYLFELVSHHMMHGPCGNFNTKCPCMVNGQCKHHYPRAHSDQTIQGRDGYPIYRRRDNGLVVEVRGCPLNSQWVVPYNPYLLYRYDCHINVEVCSGLTAVKYLYKYIYKGHDKISFHVSPSSIEPYVDEIKTFQDARWVSAPEAMWRIFEFDLNEISPPVINLPLHLPNQQCVTFWNNQNLQNVLDSGYVGKTMLTEYFSTCCADNEARKYLYSEFPCHFVWDNRKRAWNRRKQGKVIGRVNSSNPIEGERYYLRLLLLHVRGPRSYDDLLTVGTKLCFTFKESAQVRGLLECDESNFQCLNEAVNFQMPYALRRLFATILVHCQPSDVRRLWDVFYRSLSEDFEKSGVVSEVEIMGQTLRSVGDFLESMGKNVSMYDLPKFTTVSTHSNMVESREVMEEQSIPIASTDLVAHRHLNHTQAIAYDMIMDCVERNTGGVFFVNGAGGTGKTYLYRAILATVRSRGIIALATATSGVAASILPGGRTAHSRFKIPIEVHENSYCTVSKQSGLGNLLRLTRLIVWDEAPMCRRYAVEAVDRTLQDLVGNKEPFGGKIVLLGGDFMQVLPVIPRATIQENIDGSLIRSHLFPCMKFIILQENMRAKNDPLFCEFLLRVGAGVEPVDNKGNIKLPSEMVTKVCDEDIEALENKLIEHVYEGLHDKYFSSTYMTERAILSTKNTYVDALNEKIISLFPGEAVHFLSFDEAIDDTHNYYPEEFLNGLTPNGLPPHRLILKKNCPIMLLRNLDPSDGMCNGTRMVCRGFRDNVIHAEISVGHHAGKMVLIPRIPLSPAENEGYPFQFKRKQFPIRLCFAMTINKSQGQTIPVVGIYLPEPVFSHGQLYVALSRGISMKNTRVLIKPDISNDGDYTRTKNVVYKNLLDTVLI